MGFSVLCFSHPGPSIIKLRTPKLDLKIYNRKVELESRNMVRSSEAHAGYTFLLVSGALEYTWK